MKRIWFFLAVTSIWFVGDVFAGTIKDFSYLYIHQPIPANNTGISFRNKVIEFSFGQTNTNELSIPLSTVEGDEIGELKGQLHLSESDLKLKTCYTFLNQKASCKESVSKVTGSGIIFDFDTYTYDANQNGVNDGEDIIFSYYVVATQKVVYSCGITGSKSEREDLAVYIGVKAKTPQAFITSGFIDRKNPEQNKIAWFWHDKINKQFFSPKSIYTGGGNAVSAAGIIVTEKQFNALNTGAEEFELTEGVLVHCNLSSVECQIMMGNPYTCTRKR
jgi:hypothetical protein